MKRGISGTHHAVSPKWLQGYLNEYVWRYNHRDDGRAQFLSLILAAAVKSGATRLLSEDLNPGQKIAGLHIENPFAAAP